MRGVAAATLVACAAVARPVGAQEGENHVGLDLGGAMLVLRDATPPDLGAGAGVHWTHGLNDTFNLMAEGAWSLVSVRSPGGAGVPQTLPSWAANADVGLAYVLDVLQWVPYGGVLVGGYAFAGGTIPGARVMPGAAIALGLDYRLRPSVVVGFAVRQHFVTDGAYPSFTQAFGRIEYVLGW